MTGSKILASFTAACDVLLAIVAISAATLFGDGHGMELAIWAAVGFVLVAAGAGMTAVGLLVFGTLAAVGGIVLAGAYLPNEAMISAVAPAALGAAALLVTSISELAAGRARHDRTVEVPVTPTRRRVAVAIGVLVLVSTLLGSVAHLVGWRAAYRARAVDELMRGVPGATY